MSVSLHRRKPRSKPTSRDILAGLTVAMVLLPQSLAYAELAGVPAYFGIYAAAIAPIVAALYGSSPYLQTGPTALTSLLAFGVVVVIAAPGSAEFPALIALLALIVGLARLLIGVFRLGQIAYLLSEPVLIGFTSAAGVLILASQLPTALGVVPPVVGVMEGALWALTNPLFWQPAAILLSVATLALMVVGKRISPLFPGVLVAMILGIMYATIFPYPAGVVGHVPTGVPLPSLTLPWGSITQLLLGGVVISLVGFAEVASIARTYATEERQRWSPDREFFSQGLANISSGLLGSIPVGGSFSRSEINRQAGAKSRWSGAVAGGAILLLLPFLDLLSALPRAVLAAIVIGAIMNLIRIPPMLRLRRYSTPQFVVAGITFVLCLTLAPRIDLAILIGVLLSMSIHLARELAIEVDGVYGGGVLHLTPHGVLWFGSASIFEERVLEVLAAYPQTKKIVIHFEGLGRVDLSGAFVLSRLVDDMRQAGIEVEVKDVPPQARRIVRPLIDEEEKISRR